VHTPRGNRAPGNDEPQPHARPQSRRRGVHNGIIAAATAGLATLGLLSVPGAASATPQPTTAQVRHKLTQLYIRADRVDQQLNQAKQELAAASQRLRTVNREVALDSGRFGALRAEVGRIAVQAYEQGSTSSSVALLTSGDPQQILNRSSILLELSSANAAQVNQFLGAARGLQSARQAARRTQDGILQLRSSLIQRRKQLRKVISAQKVLLAQLTPAQQVGIGPGGPGTSGPTKYNGPTSTQAQQVVSWAYSQLGKPYVWGATGPNSYDCSGLIVAAWAHVGVSIPRVSYDQMTSLPAVSMSSLQPGDILGFAGNSHVGIYVGHGYIIDAPHAGSVVEKVPLAGWYQTELDGAVRP